MTIVDGTSKVINTTPNITMTDDDYLTIDLIQIGSTVSGSELSIIITYT